MRSRKWCEIIDSFFRLLQCKLKSTAQSTEGKHKDESLETYADYLKRFKYDRPREELLSASKKYLYCDVLSVFAEDIIPDNLKIFASSTTDSNSKKPPITDKYFLDRVLKYVRYYEHTYCRADALAIRYQWWYQRISVLIYILSAVAVISVSFQHIFHMPHEIGMIEFLAIICILLIISIGNKIGCHQRWRDYRFLAERIRYGLYVAISGWEKTPEKRVNLIHKWIEDSWCIMKFRELDAHRPAAHHLAEGDKDKLKQFILDSLINNQLRFHLRKIKDVHCRHRVISSLSTLFFWLTLVIATMHLVPVMIEHLDVGIHLPLEQSMSSLLTFLAILFPTLAAAFTGIRSHFDYRNLEVRSTIMANNLIKLMKHMENSDSLIDIQNLTKKTENLMIQENSDWYITVGLHELEKP
ncbi:MAG: hypothetical protein V2I36_06170 [Desulfopila sp.]|jgi:hypothetical protein|nr:hypothetical protein [Desulfopila sp.]